VLLHVAIDRRSSADFCDFVYVVLMCGGFSVMFFDVFVVERDVFVF
jgi:hypothetical protein